MYTLLHDFLTCFSQASEFSNVGNLGQAMRLMHERHLTELAQCRQPASETTGRAPDNKPALLNLDHPPVHTSIF